MITNSSTFKLTIRHDSEWLTGWIFVNQEKLLKTIYVGRVQHMKILLLTKIRIFRYQNVLWITAEYNWVFNICKPEEGWYGQPKYCYKKQYNVVLISFAVVFGLLVPVFYSRLKPLSEPTRLEILKPLWDVQKSPTDILIRKRKCYFDGECKLLCKNLEIKSNQICRRRHAMFSRDSTINSSCCLRYSWGRIKVLSGHDF